MKEKIEQNAMEFYQMAYEGNPRKATESYVGSEYIQHNHHVENGIEGFIAYFNECRLNIRTNRLNLSG